METNPIDSFYANLFFLVNLNNGFEQRLDVVSRRACSTRVRSKADSDHRTAHRISTCFRAPRFLNFRVFSQNIDIIGSGEINYPQNQRWSRGHKARGQGQGHKKNPTPRPRTAFPRTDTLEAKDRNAQGQGPRTQAQVLSKKKKKVFTKIF